MQVPVFVHKHTKRFYIFLGKKKKYKMRFSIFSLFNRLCIIEAVSYYRENFNRTGERADSLKGQPALLLLLLLPRRL
jgi:hypothetical protein